VQDGGTSGVELRVVATSQMFRSLRYRSARLFFVGLSVSQIGTWIQLTAMSLLVYRLTGKAADVGITLLCQFLPMLVLGVWAGAIADRADKQRMAFITQALQAAQAIAIGVLELAGLANLGVVYFMSFVLGVIAAIDNPARRGFVIELVEPEDISNVVSLNTAVMTGSRIFGPAIAALLVGPLGPGWLFIVNGISFAAILWPIATIDRSTRHIAAPAARGGTPVRDALRYVRGRHELLVIFVVFTVVGTFAFNYNVSFLKLADDRFGSKTVFGWLLALSGVGSLVGSLMTAQRSRVTARWFFGAALILAVSGFGVSFAPNVWVAYAITVPLGGGGAAFIASLNAISQQDSPPDMRGRLLALGAVAFLGTTPIGAPITGWIADHISAEWSLAYGSVAAILAVAVGAAARRRPDPVTADAAASHRLDVPADEHPASAMHVDHADGRGLVVEGGTG